MQRMPFDTDRADDEDGKAVGRLDLEDSDTVQRTYLSDDSGGNSTTRG